MTPPPAPSPSQPLVKFESFVRLASFFYNVTGIIPFDDGKLTWKRAIFFDVVFYVGFFNLMLLLVGETIYTVDAFSRSKDFLVAMLALSYIGFILVATIKILSIWLKKKELALLLRKLQKLFPKTPNEQEALEVRRYLRQCTRITVSFGCYSVVLAWTYNLFAIMQWLIYDRWLKVRSIEKTLPYFMYIPWDWHDNWTYYFLYAIQIFAGVTSSSGQISSDLLLCAVATQVIMHYDHVARTIENFELKANKHQFNINNNGRRGALQRDNEADLEFLKNIISYHDEVLSLSAVMNDVFGIPLLVNFMCGCFVLCFVSFQMAVGTTDTDFQIKLFMYLFSTLVQIFLICNYGQLLINASTNIATAVYKHNWTNADIRYKKMLVLIAERAQKPTYLKATNFISISRNTMTDLLQISYKFFALLRTMYRTRN